MDLLITRETDYALRILRALADGQQLTSADICQREILPQNFVYKILKKLNKSGIVYIARGAEGGCKLTADLKKISLYDLMEIIETKKDISSCMDVNFNCAWRQKYGQRCKVHGNLGKIQEALNQQLKSYSIYKILFEDSN